jgi:4-hydroxybenzoate polyprenyltransferase
MKMLLAFFRLIRSLNLLFIVLTQVLFYFFVVIPIFNDAVETPPLNGINFIFLCFSSVLVAAAGYIINDYFDLNIDRINKPDKLVVEKIINRRWAILWHWILSLLGIAIGFYIGFRENIFWIGFANLFCVIALWFYSTTFKKKLLTGNILISLLTAWVVLVVGFAEHYKVMDNLNIYGGVDRSKLLRFTFLYSGFAFIISLVREVIKDIEDMEGDAKFGCKTMPVVWGVIVSKVFSATWLVVLLATVVIVMIYMLQLHWWVPAVYCLVMVILPLLLILRKISTAQKIQDYHRISNMLKIVMLTGILSMTLLSIH